MVLGDAGSEQTSTLWEMEVKYCLPVGRPRSIGSLEINRTNQDPKHQPVRNTGRRHPKLSV